MNISLLLREKRIIMSILSIWHTYNCTRIYCLETIGTSRSGYLRSVALFGFWCFLYVFVNLCHDYPVELIIKIPFFGVIMCNVAYYSDNQSKAQTHC